MGLEIIGSGIPGGLFTYTAFATLIAAMGGIVLTRSAAVGLFAGFGTCWALTILGFVPLWTSALCSMAIVGGLAAWRLWVRD